MNIQNKPVIVSQCNLNFTAIPLARYQTIKGDSVCVYQLEKKDKQYVSNFVKNIKQYFKDKQIDDFSHKQVMEEAFSAAEKILASPNESKAKVFLAVNRLEPCGIIIGNVSKKSHSGQIVYSSRKNHARKETELDWLATWNSSKNKPIKGVGKMLISEYFDTLTKDGFRDVYVRSEVPERSYAQSLYDKMGFEVLQNKRENIIKTQTNRYVIGNYDYVDDKIVPMIATSSAWKKAKNAVFNLFKRKCFERNSVCIDTVVR